MLTFPTWYMVQVKLCFRSWILSSTTSRFGLLFIEVWYSEMNQGSENWYMASICTSSEMQKNRIAA